MKRILCIVLALMMLIMMVPSALAAEDKVLFRLKGPEGACKVGETITVVGRSESAPACASFKITITYDTKVLQPLGGKIDSSVKGLSIVNHEAKYENQPAVIALAADSAKSFEGITDLFTVQFKVIGQEKDAKGSLLNVAYQEFFNTELKQLGATIMPCRIITEGSGSSSESGNGGEAIRPNDPDPEQPDEKDPESGKEDTNEPSKPSGDTESENKKPDKNEGQETDKDEDKKPEGDWIITDDELAYIDEDGNESYYKPEYEKDEDGNITGIIIYDDEGNKKGELSVEQNEDGTLNVIEQELIAEDGENTPGAPLWIWLVIGGAVVLAGGVVALIILLSKKKEDSAK